MTSDAYHNRMARNREFRNRKAERSPVARWYASKAWRRKREVQLAREPQCAMCIAMNVFGVLATVADHIVPHRGDRDLFWKGKLQSLCETCHDARKQADEARGFSLVVHSGGADDGWPMDGQHAFNTGKMPRRARPPYRGRKRP